MNRIPHRIAAALVIAAVVGGCAQLRSPFAATSASASGNVPMISDNDNTSSNPNTGGDSPRGGDSARGQAARF